MKLDSLRIFYYAARSKSFTYNELNLSTSAVSRQVSQLEYELNCKLFHRYPRKLVLTDKGETLFKKAHNIFTQIDSIKDLLIGKNQRPSGTLRIAVPPSEGAWFIIDHISKYLEAYPEMLISIIEENNEPDFSSGLYDVALCHYISNQVNIKHKHFLKCHPKLYASKKYLEKFGVPFSIDDLHKHRIITNDEYNRLPKYIQWPLEIGLPKGKIRSPYLITSDVLYALTQGLGIGVLATEIPTKEEKDQYGLVEVLPGIAGPEVDIYFIFHAHLETSPRFLTFYAFMKDILINEYLKDQRLLA
jgi:DNA-binding transcriptional LysR family regulator